MNQETFYKKAFVSFLNSVCNLAFGEDKISAEDFINETLADGVVIMESANMALQISNNVNLRSFSERIISEHSRINAELTDIARRKKIDIAYEEELAARTQIIKELNAATSFEKNYIGNQIRMTEDVMRFFERAIVSDDLEIANFAKTKLPSFQSRLKMARELPPRM